ncbi:19463_t:CDS:2, partial [Gigaspora margarita]
MDYADKRLGSGPKKATKLEEMPCTFKMKKRELVKTKDMLDIGKCYQNRTQKSANTNIAKRVFKIGDRYQGIIDEACGWCLRSTKKANSAGKFDP